jgi:glycine betaine/proline transport system permease protein
MAFYDGFFNAFGLRAWCDAATGTPKLSMASLLAKTNPDAANEGPIFPFPSMDELYQACPSFPQSREFTAGVEEAFLNVKDVLK